MLLGFSVTEIGKLWFSMMTGTAEAGVALSNNAAPDSKPRPMAATIKTRFEVGHLIIAPDSDGSQTKSSRRWVIELYLRRNGTALLRHFDYLSQCEGD